MGLTWPDARNEKEIFFFVFLFRSPLAIKNKCIRARQSYWLIGIWILSKFDLKLTEQPNRILIQIGVRVLGSHKFIFFFIYFFPFFFFYFNRAMEQNAFDHVNKIWNRFFVWTNIPKKWAMERNDGVGGWGGLEKWKK